MKESIILGFANTIVSVPGVSTKPCVELPYKADILTYNKQYAAGEGKNDNMEYRNRYSILMNRKKEFYADLKYIKMGQTKWEVSALEFLPPRIILTVGGIYNGG